MDYPTVTVDGAGRAHLVWAVFQDISYARLDPSLDDQNGDAADPTVVVVAPQQISVDDSITSIWPQAQVDGGGGIHVVWEDRSNGSSGSFRRIKHTKLHPDASVAITEQSVFLGDLINVDVAPVLALDAAGDVHLAWNGDDFSTRGVYYALLDGSFGFDVIAPTNVLPGGFHPADVGFVSLGLTPAGEALVVFQAALTLGDGSVETFLLRLDPSLDDRNGDAADAGLITTLTPTQVSPDDAVDSDRPAAAFDAAGNVHLAYFDRFEEDPFQADLLFAVLDADAGVVMPLQRVSEGRIATPSSGTAVAVEAPAGFVTWRDRTDGTFVGRLSLVNPDFDAEGLTNVEERLLGTDRRDPDTDGGGRTDAEEVLVDGTDPLDPVDDLNS